MDPEKKIVYRARAGIPPAGEAGYYERTWQYLISKETDKTILVYPADEQDSPFNRRTIRKQALDVIGPGTYRNTYEVWTLDERRVQEHLRTMRTQSEKVLLKRLAEAQRGLDKICTLQEMDSWDEGAAE